MISGPTAGAICRSTKFWSSDPGQQVTKMISRAGFAGPGQSAADERGHAAGGDADHDVLVGQPQPADAAGALLVVVFDAFLRPEHRFLSAGHDRLHHFRTGAEGRRHFRGFDHAQAAAGAGADEDDAAAFLEGLGHDLDPVGDPFLFLQHGADDFAVLVDDHLDDVANGSLVDGEGNRVDGFSRKRLPFRSGRHEWSVCPKMRAPRSGVQPLTVLLTSGSVKQRIAACPCPGRRGRSLR